jgi:hypothetical protein
MKKKTPKLGGSFKVKKIKKFLDLVGSFIYKKKKSQKSQTNQLLSQKSNTQLTLEQGVSHTLALPTTLKGI